MITRCKYDATAVPYVKIREFFPNVKFDLKYTVSQKTVPFLFLAELCQKWIDFNDSFTVVTLKFLYTNLELNMPHHLNCVAALPSKCIQMRLHWIHGWLSYSYSCRRSSINIATSTSVCMRVILSMCPHDKTKMTETAIIKLATGIVRHKSSSTN